MNAPDPLLVPTLRRAAATPRGFDVPALLERAADLIDAQKATIDEQAAEIARLNRIVLTADTVIERLAGRASDGGDL